MISALRRLGGDQLFIDVNGEIQIVVLGLLSDLSGGIIVIDGQAHEGDAMWIHFLAQFRERLGIAGGHGAFKGIKDEDNRLLALEIVKRVRFAGVVLEGKIGDFFAKIGVGWFTLGLNGGS